MDAIKVPVLLIHGRDDTVVSFDQSTVMFDAMKHAKKDVEMVTLKNEDHWLSHSETRLQMLQVVSGFPAGPQSTGLRARARNLTALWLTWAWAYLGLRNFRMY